MIVIMMIVMMVILVMLVFARIVSFLMEDFTVLSDAFKVRLKLAVTLTLRQRTDLHVDVSAGHPRFLIDMAHGKKIFFDLFCQHMPKLLVRHLPAAELKLNAHLVAFGQEVFGVRDLDQVVVRVDADPELHFLHLAALLMLVGFLLVLLLDVFVFAVVDDLADGWIGIRRDLHEV